MTDLRITKALQIIYQNAGDEGAHHKDWVIDQVVRILTEDGYEEWVEDYENGEDGPDSYEWQTGIP